MTVLRLDHAVFDWASGSGGAEGVRRVAAQALAVDGREALNEAAELTLRHHGLETSVLLVSHDGQGATTGFAFVHGLSGPGRPELELVVAPAARDRGAGTALATAVLEVLDGIPVTAWSHGNHPAAARIAARLGFHAARELLLMRRPAVLGAAPAAAVPDGVTLRAFRAPADEEGLLAVNAAAFADHPEQGALDLAALRERMAEDWFDADGLLVAEQDGSVVGFHWTKAHRPPGGPPHGEVYVIGVSPDLQGSGLGRALLSAGLEHLRSAGLGEVVLYVEAANTGAVRLYESYGFAHDPADTDVMYAPRL